MPSDVSGLDQRRRTLDHVALLAHLETLRTDLDVVELMSRDVGPGRAIRLLAAVLRAAEIDPPSAT